MKEVKTSLILLICLIMGISLFAQKKTGSIQGIVTDFNSSEPLSGVLIKIDGISHTGHTDADGEFLIKDVPVGKYNLMCMKQDCYCTMSDAIRVEPGKVTHVRLKMLEGNPQKFLYFSIGGITVTAERDLVPESHETVHKISSGQIEHMQATNLGDILDLIPGVERKSRPGLNQQSFIGLRGAETDHSYDRPDIFGTKIILDEIPLSNNANMNAGSYVGYGSQVQTNARAGIDLRSVVADNIKEVEVVSGVPSVEYGDLTSGIVKVKTQAEANPLRLKMKTNPDTREMNLNGGNKIFRNTTLNYNVNYAYSEKDLRQDGDEVSRISGQLNLINNFPNHGLSLKNRFYYTRIFEDYYLPDDPKAVRASSKDYRMTFGSVIDKKFNKDRSLNFTGYLNYNRRKSYRREFEVVDPTYVTSLRHTGITEGILLADPYFWEVNTLGNEYSLGLKLKLKQRFMWKNMVHNFLAGTEYNYDVNKGSGKQFDPLFPPNGTTGRRPRSFDDIPGFDQLSLFFEDRITGETVMPYTLTLGVRGEMYNPQGLGGSKLVESQNGTFWNPRMGLQLKPLKGVQVRASYGLTSKAPALIDIYPGPVYHDVMEWGRDPNDPTGQDSIPLLRTQVYRLNNDNLQGYQQQKFELGLDFSLKNVGLSMTGYRQKTDGSVSTINLPYTDRRYFWTNWPSQENPALLSEQPIILRDYERKANLGWLENEGMEFSLRTHRIKSLNMMFTLTGAFNYKRWGGDDSNDLDTPKAFQEITTAGDTIAHYGYPMYPTTSGWRKSFFMNYNIDYVNRTLGIWITFTMYHKIYEKRKNTDLATIYNYATGYYENGQYYSLTPAQAAAYGLYSTESEGAIIVYRQPANFYFNLTVSKNIYEGMEVSLFVNNFLNQRGFYTDQYGYDKIANPEIFYGMEFSMVVNPFAEYLRNRLF